jgi:error-prone DNA polymerase
MTERYAELHAYSCFSFRRGASHVEDLMERAWELGLSGLAITDRDGLYGSVRQWLHDRRLREAADDLRDQPPAPALRDPQTPKPRVGARNPHQDREVEQKAREEERLHERRERQRQAASRFAVPRPVYGAELCLDDGSRVVALVENRAGWRNLSALITESRMGGEKGVAFLPFSRLVERRDGLFVLSGGRFGPVDRALLGLDGLRAWQGWSPKGPWGRELGAWSRDAAVDPRALLAEHRQRLPLLRAQRDDPAARRRRATEAAARFRDAFGDRFFLEVSDHLLPEDQWLRGLLRGVADELSLPRVATNLAHYARASDRRLQDVLTCIRVHTTLQDAGTRLLPNDRFGLLPPAAMGRLFSGDVAPVARSAEIADACTFDLEALPYAFPVHPVPPGHTLQTHLEELTWEGAGIRYGARLETDPRIRGQIRHELDVIGRMGLAGYFLIVWDISRECRRRGVLSQGRGSAANSCVCYCLQITAVDPIKLELLFERFLSEARGGYPDIDIDVSNSKREEILQYVYERYGRDHAAMVCNVITYHPRSAIRDVGKAFGLGLDQVDRMAKALSHFSSGAELAERFGEGGDEAISEDSHLLRQVVEFTDRLCGFPRHIGIHSGGVVVSGVPIGEACPTENASMEDRTVLQWDKDDVAHTGLVKIDVLALGMLSVIQEARRLLALRGIDFDMAQLTYDDPAVYDMICEADTVGLFQIESRAQMNTLPRLKPRTFHDLVVEVALIRPGPIQGDMVHPYLRRRAGEEPVVYAHPSLKPILERTMGIPLFQEQAMKMAIATAGFTPGEADKLRKVMGFKRSSDEMERLFAKMIDGMERNGIDRDTAHRIRDQLRGFAAYGFPESHSASFALIVYASAWLKRYEPAAFAAGLLNCQPMGFYTPATIVADARRHGVTIHPLCVNRSDHRWALEGAMGLRGAFLQIQGFSEDDGLRIEEVRAHGGPFTSVADVCERTGLGRSKLEALARAGAFSTFGVDRRQAQWQVAGWRKRLPLEGPARQETLPGFEPLGVVEENLLDHAVAGFTPREHPLVFAREELARRGYRGSQELMRLKDGQGVMVAGLVITRQRPMTAKGTFFITLEDEAGFVNIIVHAKTFERERRMLSRSKFLGIRGRLQREAGVCSVLGSSFVDLAREELLTKAMPAWEKWGGMPSRDFH